MTEGVEISPRTYQNMLKRCENGEHRWRGNAYGAWCTVCGRYGGIYLGADRADPEAPDLIVKGDTWTARIKG